MKPLASALDSDCFPVPNDVFDLKLTMPPLYKLVWLCLQRYAHEHPKRLVQGVPLALIAQQCHVDLRTATKAVQYLVSQTLIEPVAFDGSPLPSSSSSDLSVAYHVTLYPLSAECEEPRQS